MGRENKKKAIFFPLRFNILRIILNIFLKATILMDKELTICVTGAAGQIGYSFIPQLLRGNVFPDVKLHLKMLDITPALGVLKGLAL